VFADKPPQDSIFLLHLLKNAALEHVYHKLLNSLIADKVVSEGRYSSFPNDQAHSGDVVGQPSHDMLLHLKHGPI